MSYQQDKFKEIADAIREKTGTSDLIKPSNFASKIDDVYSAGQNASGGGSYDEGIADGKQEMRKSIMDDIQVNGGRSDYRFAFAYMNGDNFYPNYDIKPTGSNVGSNMFYKFDFSSPNNPVSLVERIDDRGFKLDLSGLTGTWQLPFGYAMVSDIGEIDVSNVTLDRCFMGAIRLTKIVKLIVSDKNTFVNQYGGVFSNCDRLTDIEFEGVIANDIDFQYSPLNRRSIENVVSVLSDSTTDKTITFKETAIDDAFTESEWKALMDSKPNWSFALR